MADPVLTYAMKGQLRLSNSGWALLSVPNAIGNGCFKALDEHGVEQPVSGEGNQYNAHISVMRPEEIASIGGPSAIKAFGKSYGFNLGSVREIANPGGWSEVAKCWVIEAKSPELMDLRKSLGLPPPKYPFHITFAIRKRKSKEAATPLVIRKSQIQGNGLFATKDIDAGDVVEPKFLLRWTDPDDEQDYWDQSEFCRYTNHSAEPNCVIRVSDSDPDRIELVAIKNIDGGDELTCDYADMPDEIQSQQQFTYRGKPYGGESDEELMQLRKQADVTQMILRTLRGE